MLLTVLQVIKFEWVWNQPYGCLNVDTRYNLLWFSFPITAYLHAINKRDPARILVLSKDAGICVPFFVPIGIKGSSQSMNTRLCPWVKFPEEVFRVSV